MCGARAAHNRMLPGRLDPVGPVVHRQAHGHRALQAHRITFFSATPRVVLVVA